MSAAAAPGALDVGIHYDVAHSDYHGDPCVEPSLSRSVCWTLAQRAAIHGYLEHPRLNTAFEHETPSELMSFGDLAHELMLGHGERIEISKWKDFKTQDARAWRDDCWSRGMIPTKPETLERAKLLQTCAMAYLGGAGFGEDFEAAKKEVTVVSRIDGLMCRCRFDALRIDPEGAKHRQHSEIAIAFDLKITGDANPETIAGLIGAQGYDLQEKFYLATLSAAERSFAGKVRWVFLFIENKFPHVVTPVELNGEFRAIGSKRFERGFAKWKRGIQKGEWPAFTEGEGAFVVGPKKYLALQELEDESPVAGIRLSEGE